MPENLAQDEQALDWATTANPDDQRAIAVKQKLGVNDEDLKAYSWAKDNQQDMRAVVIKNTLFDKIANSTPGENVQGVKINERLVIKNLIDTEPKVQVEYLKRKGYDTRVIGGEVEAKKPGDINFKKIDPKGFDLWDATDILSDIGQAVVSTIAGVSTGVTGPAALIAGPAAAGAAGALYEGVKQDVANMAGFRDGYTAQPVIEAGVLNAAGEFGGRLISGAFKAVSSGLKSLTGLGGIAKKGSSEAIEAASKEIGATPTAGMLTDSPTVQTLEESMFRRKGTLGGMGLRKTIEGNKKAAFDTAKTIVQDASAKTQHEVGYEVADKIIDQFAKRLEPAENIYSKYETAFEFARPKRTDITNIFDAVRSEFSMNEGAQTALAKFEKVAVGEGKGGEAVINLEGLKELRSEVGAAMREATNGRTKQALQNLYGQLTGLRSETLLKYAKGKGQAFYEAAAKEIPMADTIYRDAMNDAKQLVGKDVGDRMSGFAKSTIADFMRDTNKATLVKDLLKTGNPEKVEFFAKKYPEVFKEMRQGAIADIAERAMIKGEVDPARLTKILRSMPPESRAMILGTDATKKFEALKVYLDNIPKMQNPSGTAAAISNSKMWGLVTQGHALMQSLQYDLMSNPALGKDVFNKLGTFFAKPAVKAAGQFGIMQLPEPQKVFMPGQSQPSFNQPVFMPRAQQ